MEEIKYPALDFIRTIYRFIGWFILFITLIVIAARTVKARMAPMKSQLCVPIRRSQGGALREKSPSG